MSVTNVKRKSRNESEKRRRDAFNQLINELTALVADGDRKMDKSNVLKCAIKFLQDRQPYAESTTEDANCDLETGKQCFAEENPKTLVQIYMDTLNAGTFCLSCNGAIYQISTNFASLFGYTVAEMLKQNFMKLLNKESEKHFNEVLSSEVLRAAASASSNVISNTEPPIIQATVVEKRFRRRIVMFGRVKKVLKVYSSNDRYVCPVGCEQKQSVSGENESSAEDSQQKSSLCFVGIASSTNCKNVPEITSECFPTNWKPKNFTIVYNNIFLCLQTDLSCKVLLGYSRNEMLGTSGYDYVHIDDLRMLVKCHQRLMRLRKTEIEPHRLRTKAKQWIWLECSARIEGSENVQRIHCSYSVTGKPALTPEQLLQFERPVDKCQTVPQMQTTLNCGATLEDSIVKKLQNFTELPSHKKLPKIPPDSSLPIYNTLNSDTISAESAKPRPSEHSPTCLNTSIFQPPLSKVSAMSTNSALTLGIKYDLKCPHNPCSKSQYEPSQSDDYEKTCSFYNSVLFDSQSLQNSSSPKTAVPSLGFNSLPNSPFNHSGPMPKKRFLSSMVNPNEILSSENVGHVQMETNSVIISPTYRHLWEELQKKSDILRQQVLQKELELQQLQFKQFFATYQNAKP